MRGPLVQVGQREGTAVMSHRWKYSVILAVVMVFSIRGAAGSDVELEVYAGGITGDSIGAAYQSATRGSYGARFNVGVWRFFNFNVDYLYSNQSRSFTAVTPATSVLPTGTAVARAGNLNVVFGSGEFNLIRRERMKLYLSPGIGWERNGARNLTLITPVGAASSSLLAGNAVTFNLGGGVKVYPWKHLGLRFDLRDHVSGGGTGDLNPSQDVSISGSSIANPQQFFGKIPVQNNIVFTVGLIFKIR